MKKPLHVSTESPILSRITDLLIQKGISQKQLLQQLGLTRGIYTEWKANRSDSYLKYIDQIAVFLETSPTYLLRGESEPKDVKPEAEGTCELMQIYRRLNPEQQERLVDIARSIENGD